MKIYLDENIIVRFIIGVDGFVENVGPKTPNYDDDNKDNIVCVSLFIVQLSFTISGIDYDLQKLKKKTICQLGHKRIVQNFEMFLQ